MSDVVDILFSVKDQTARIARFEMRHTRETAEGGIVGVGVRGGTTYIVHEPRGRKVESITSAAVATAIAHGVISHDLLVGAFAEVGGALDALAAAVKAAIDERDAPVIASATPGRQRAA